MPLGVISAAVLVLQYIFQVGFLCAGPRRKAQISLPGLEFHEKERKGASRESLRSEGYCCFPSAPLLPRAEPARKRVALKNKKLLRAADPAYVPQLSLTAGEVDQCDDSGRLRARLGCHLEWLGLRVADDSADLMGHLVPSLVVQV